MPARLSTDQGACSLRPIVSDTSSHHARPSGFLEGGCLHAGVPLSGGGAVDDVFGRFSPMFGVTRFANSLQEANAREAFQQFRSIVVARPRSQRAQGWHVGDGFSEQADRRSFAGECNLGDQGP